MKRRLLNLRKRDFSCEEGHLLRDEPSQQLKRYERNYTDEDFVRDNTDKDLPVFSADPKATPASDLKKPSPVSRFNWLSFWTMLVSIAVVVFLVIIVPGPFDEIGAAIVLSALNAFIANYRK